MSETKRTSLGLVLLVNSMYIGAAYLWSVSPGQAAPPVPIQAPSAAQITRYMAQDRLRAQYRQAEATLARQFKAEGCSDQYAGLAAEAAVDNHLPPRIVGALVFVESSCRPDAVSPKSAVGLMQVNERVWHYSRTELQDPQRNLQIGTQILASYVRQSGLRDGLRRYNGLGASNPYGYSDRVLQVAKYQTAR